MMYRPDLEELSAQTQAFAASEHQKTLQWIHAKNPDVSSLKQNFLNALCNHEHLPLCEEHHDQMYHFLQDEQYPKGIYRVAQSTWYRAGLPDWKILFSVADFDDLLHDDVYLTGIVHCETAPHLVLLSLSPAGSDAAYTIEFDLNTRTLVPNGFHFPLGKNHIAYQDANSVFVAPAWADFETTQSGYPRHLYLFKRGENFDDLKPILSCEEEDVSIEAWRYLDTQGKDLDIALIRHGFFSESYFHIHENGSMTPIPIPKESEICGFLGGHLLLRLRESWHRTHTHYPTGSIVAVKYAKGQLQQGVLLFSPEHQQSVECVETSRRFVLIHYLNHVSGCLKLWHYHKGQWIERNSPNLSCQSIEIIDQPYGGDIFYLIGESMNQAPVLYAFDAHLNELSVMRKRRSLSSLPLKTETFFAVSADGTSIPYSYCGTQKNAPAIIHVYGGFGVSLTPQYQEIITQFWLNHGYSFILAHVRGGGELGPDWHHAAQREHKQRSIDDLLAIVQDAQQRCLVSQNATILQGGSNGGFIVAAAIAQQPDLFAAAVCEVPLSDMERFHLMGAGNSWIEEYGHPEKKPFQAALKALSPLNRLQSNIHYPPIWITANWNDDRVSPSHALKLHAKLQEIQATSYLYMEDIGGHENQSNPSRQAEQLSAVFSFLYEIVNKNIAKPN